MPLTEFEIKKIEKIVSEYCEQKIPPHLKNDIRITFMIIKNEVWIYEKRPVWDNPSEWHEMPVAKIRCTLKTRLWTLYWPDRNSRWHIYDRIKPNKDISKIIEEIDNDPTRIFWG